MKALAMLAITAVCAGGASAQIDFYPNDESGFMDDLGGAPQIGILEDMENNIAPDGIVETLANPLEGGVPNGSFTKGLRNEHLTVRSVDDNGDGLVDMVLLTDGFVGQDSDVVGTNQFADSTEIESTNNLGAISFEMWSLVGGATSYTVEVFDTEGALLGMETISNMSEPMFLGIISADDNIGSVRIAGVGGTGELVDNIATYGPGANECYADCNGDEVLNILDFVCYQGIFESGDPAADCNGDQQLNILDFVCFQNEFGEGCL